MKEKDKPYAIQGNVSFVELPYQKDKRKYWCKIVIAELKNGHNLPISVHTANEFLKEYDKTFDGSAGSNVPPPKSKFYI